MEFGLSPIPGFLFLCLVLRFGSVGTLFPVAPIFFARRRRFCRRFTRSDRMAFASDGTVCRRRIILLSNGFKRPWKSVEGCLCYQIVKYI